MRRLLGFLCATIAIGISPFCAQAHDSTMWGTAVGASLGGLVGSTIGKGSGRLAATGAGVFLGGALGHSVGRSLERPFATHPRVYSYDAYTPRFHGYTPTYVAPPGPTPHIVYVQPRIVEYRRSAAPVYIQEGYVGPPGSDRLRGRQCREFKQKIKIDGQLVESYGNACRDPDGTWRIVP